MPHPGPGQVLMRTIYIGIAPGAGPLLPHVGMEPDVANDGIGGPDRCLGRRSAQPDANPGGGADAIGHRAFGFDLCRWRGGARDCVQPRRVQPGDFVFGGRLWQDYEVVDGDALLRLDPVADEFSRCGVLFRPARKADRLTGWNIMRRLLSDAGKPDVPGLYISRACEYFWSTVPYLARDQKRVEDVDSSGPDHAADAVRYGCLRRDDTMKKLELSGW